MGRQKGRRANATFCAGTVDVSTALREGIYWPGRAVGEPREAGVPRVPRVTRATGRGPERRTHVNVPPPAPRRHARGRLWARNRPREPGQRPCAPL